MADRPPQKVSLMSGQDYNLGLSLMGRGTGLPPSSPEFCGTFGVLHESEEDKRATTNLQNGLVFFFLLSCRLFKLIE